jgi:hypothetical protein
MAGSGVLRSLAQINSKTSPGTSRLQGCTPVKLFRYIILRTAHDNDDEQLSFGLVLDSFALQLCAVRQNRVSNRPALNNSSRVRDVIASTLSTGGVFCW